MVGDSSKLGAVIPHVAAEAPVPFGVRHDSDAKVPSESRPAGRFGSDRVALSQEVGVNCEDGRADCHLTDAAGDVRVVTLRMPERSNGNQVEHIAVHVWRVLKPVSYTHLTLPTIYSV